MQRGYRGQGHLALVLGTSEKAEQIAPCSLGTSCQPVASVRGRETISRACPCGTRAIVPAMRGIHVPNPSAGPGRDRRVSDTAQPPGSGHACPRRGEKRHQGS